MLNKPGIYIITNSIANKNYIGQSLDIKKRLTQHKSNLKNGRADNDYLQKAWNKVNGDGFLFDVLMYCDEDALDFWEIFYIRLFNSVDKGCGYNFETGGNANKIISPETRVKMSKAWVGRVVSIKTRQLQSRQRCGQLNNRARRVIDSNTGKIYNCAKDAAIDLGINYYTLISKLTNKDRNNTGVKYVDEDGVMKCLGRKVIDTASGIVYNNYSEAATAFNWNPGTLRKWLGGQRPNKTTLTYVEE